LQLDVQPHLLGHLGVEFASAKQRADFAE